MQAYWIQDGTLTVDGQTVLCDMGPGISALADEAGVGVFLAASAPQAGELHHFDLGRLPELERFTSCHRDSPWWMVPRAGKRLSEVKVETQFFLAELRGGRYLLALPLINNWFRARLEGTPADHLALVAETGDPDTVGRELTGLFLAVGNDPYTLVEASARAVLARLKTGRPRAAKPLPEFADYFGWCTWDAFYQQVSADKVIEGLKSFAEGGVQPRYLILDDGWQTVQKMPSGESRLTAFAANDKFPGGLRGLTRECKELYGIRTFLVWHAMNGYWGGVDGTALTAYQVSDTRRTFGPGIVHYSPQENDEARRASGLVPPSQIDRFFNDYHRYLMRQGVDGVKVDNQAVLESLGEDQGGRVELMRSYREALEGSVHSHFLGNLINCMSCSNDMFLQALNSNLTRSSTDFWPRRPESHGLHLYTNAQTSLWLGEFVHPDWDMFQSGHPNGAMHAAARAVGGCPIYVSDKPDGHDFALLRKLVLSDGRVLRCRRPGRPTRDCLFADVLSEPVLLKIFNTNHYGGIVGVFNARYHAPPAERPALTGQVRPLDIEGLAGEQFAVYLHKARLLLRLSRAEGVALSVAETDYELATVMPIEADFAPIGLVEQFNSGGAVLMLRYLAEGRLAMRLADGGEFLAWSAREPKAAWINGASAGFSYDPASHALRLHLPLGGPCLVELSLAPATT